jgi:hypothetical protein
MPYSRSATAIYTGQDHASRRSPASASAVNLIAAAAATARRQRQIIAMTAHGIDPHSAPGR